MEPSATALEIREGSEKFMASTAIDLPGLKLNLTPLDFNHLDPGRREAWWWLGLPLLTAISIIAIAYFAPVWFRAYMHPEGYGVLELSQFFVALGGFFIALKLLMQGKVRQHSLLTTFLTLAALACLYIAGEEMSWGQHFFHWDTPEYWSTLNRQNETNLHNTYDIFDKTPRLILEIGILIGGIILPLAAIKSQQIKDIDWAIFFPPIAIMPVALTALFFKLLSMVHSEFHIGGLFPRPSEVTELFLYLFLLFYMIIFARRMSLLPEANQN